jgi:hypothetical protein
MARLPRSEVSAPDEVATLHISASTVRRCLLLGLDPLTNVCYDHRKAWLEDLLVRAAACFGVQLLAYDISSNNFQLCLKQRPDLVRKWTATEVAVRWLTMCPIRKNGGPPTEAHLNLIRNNPELLEEIRSRLSDISWWMRLVCQRLAQRCNREDAQRTDREGEEMGKFFQARFRATRTLDEASVLASSAYVDLTPIWTGRAETLEDSEFTSVQRRIQSLVMEVEELARRASPAAELTDMAANNVESTCVQSASVSAGDQELERLRPDRHLAPVTLDQFRAELRTRSSKSPYRCSDDGYLPMTTLEYLELLDWTAKQVRTSKPGTTPADAPPLLERLSISPKKWLVLVSEFGKLFSAVAGMPAVIDQTPSRVRKRRYHVPPRTRELLEGSVSPATEATVA